MSWTPSLSSVLKPILVILFLSYSSFTEGANGKFFTKFEVENVSNSGIESNQIQKKGKLSVTLDPGPTTEMEEPSSVRQTLIHLHVLMSFMPLRN